MVIFQRVWTNIVAARRRTAGLTFTARCLKGEKIRKEISRLLTPPPFVFDGAAEVAATGPLPASALPHIPPLATDVLICCAAAAASLAARSVLAGGKRSGTAASSPRTREASSNLERRSFQWSCSTSADAEKMFGLRVVSTPLGPPCSGHSSVV